MCGRFDLDPGLPEIKRMIDSRDLDIKTGEVFPADRALVLTGKDGRLEPAAMVWGFPQFNRKGVIFNARAETALKKPLFRKALFQNPVAVPTTGFYEWKTDPVVGKKVRYRFHIPNQPVTWLAGFCNTFRDGQRFTILTTDANDAMSAYHDRMPVILHENECMDWLDGTRLKEYLARVPPELDARRIG